MISKTAQAMMRIVIHNRRIALAFIVAVAAAANAVGKISATSDTVPLQADTTLTLLVHGDGASAARTLHVEAMDRRSALFPRQIEAISGRAELPIFARREGALELFVYDASTKRESAVTLNVARGTQTGVIVEIETQEGASMVRTMDQVRLGGRFEGSRQPQTVHLTVRDARGRRVVSRFYAASELGDTRTRFAVPMAGWCEFELLALAEPITQFPLGATTLPEAYPREQRTNPLIITERETTPGLSVAGVMGARVVLENVPSTATVLGRDKFPMVAIATPPIENRLYKSLFGIGSGGLLSEPLGELVSTANSRMRRHYRVGSRWGREQIVRDVVEPRPGNYTWSAIDSVARAYTGLKFKVTAVMPVPVRTNDRDGASSDVEKHGFRTFFQNVALRFGNVTAFELDSTAPLSAADARVWADIAAEELQKLGHQAQLVLRAPNLDAERFFTDVFGDNPTTAVTVLSVGMSDFQTAKSPEQLGLPDTLLSLKGSMRKHKIGDGWLTQAGWSASPGGATEAQQANYLTRLYTMASFRRVKTFWNRLQDTNVIPWRGAAEGATGLFDANGQPKLSACAYGIVQFVLSQVEATEIVTTGSAVMYSFDSIISESKWPGQVHVAWTPSAGARGEVTVTAGASGCFGVDYLGAQVAPIRVVPPYVSINDEPTTRTFTFAVDERPLFIWDIGQEVKGMQPPAPRPASAPRDERP